MSVDVLSEVQPLRIAKEQPHVVKTPQVMDIVERALMYLKAGYPVNFSSSAGMGKTTLAIYTAAQLGKPVILIHGNDEFSTSDLVGGEHGFQRKKVVDNFIHSVLKTDERIAGTWIDNHLTVACKHGFTLVYDEFTRSRPEANNVLLSVLEERILNLPAARGKEAYIQVNPEFNAIFTSNPEEYAGVYKVQNALIDRMVNIKLQHYDRETEIAIAQAKSDISDNGMVEKITDLVRALRTNKEDGSTPTIRSIIMLAKILKLSGVKASASNRAFVHICRDVLGLELRSKENLDGQSREILIDLVNKYFG